jgi:hypothetical protein
MMLQMMARSHVKKALLIIMYRSSDACMFPEHSNVRSSEEAMTHDDISAKRQKQQRHLGSSVPRLDSTDLTPVVAGSNPHHSNDTNNPSTAKQHALKDANHRRN